MTTPSTKYSRNLTVRGPNPVWIERIPLIGFKYGVVVDPPAYFTPGNWRVEITEHEDGTASATITELEES